MEALAWVSDWILPFLIVLGLLVFVHELGHFLVARWCGVRVEAFSIGFGKELVGWRDRHGTRWKLCLLPLGGYVKFFGDAGAASTADGAAMTEMSPEDKAVCFHHKPLRHRAAIVAAGPAANYLLAIVIFAGLFMTNGRLATEPVVSDVIEGSAAQAAGLLIDDRILSVDGDRVSRFQDLVDIIRLNPGTPIDIAVQRNGETLVLTAVPDVIIEEDDFGQRAIGRLGILHHVTYPVVADISAGSAAAAAGFQPGDRLLAVNDARIRVFDDLVAVVRANPDREITVTVSRGTDIVTLSAVPDPVVTQTGQGRQVTGRLGITHRMAGKPGTRVVHGPVSAVIHAVEHSWGITVMSLRAVGQMLVGDRSVSEMGGPLRIAHLSGEVAQLGIVVLLNFMALLSISLGLINLFPIPVLDGGHLLYYAVEAVRGRPLGPRVQEIGFTVGLALVVGLMLMVTINDVRQGPFLEFLKGIVS